MLQSPQSDVQGFNAAGTPYFGTPSLPYDPSEEFHEYRFDWIPGSVSFYADGQLLQVMDDSALGYDSPGHIIINHWSNGNEGWSAGPPTQDAVLTIMYVKMYFNSSDGPHSAYSKNCPAYNAGQVCQIPDQTTPPSTNSNSTPPTFFFSRNSSQIIGQSTSNTTWNTYGQHNAGSKLGAAAVWQILFSLLLCMFFAAV